MPKKKRSKPPSRQRYEEENPTVSCRLDKETHQRLSEYLQNTGTSLADFLEDALGRENSMVEERIQMLAKQQSPLSDEGRLKCLEALVMQAGVYLKDHDWPFFCPRCREHEMIYAKGEAATSPRENEDVITLKCPSCGYFLDTPDHIDPDSLEWLYPAAAEAALKPKTSPAKPKHQRKSNKGKG